MDIRAEVMAILQKRLKPEVSATDDAKLVALEIESLDMVEIMFELEDKFIIQLPQNNEAMQEATVRDLVAWVVDEVGKKPAVATPGAGS